jgi:hypothetical protein
MTRTGALRLTPYIAIGLGCSLIWASPIRAQAFVQLGGGWNYLAPSPGVAGETYTRGLNIEAAIGRALAPNVSVRLDAFTLQFDHNVRYNPPCPSPGCTESYYNAQANSVAGITANGLLNVGSSGIFYVIGGAGLYDAHVPGAELHFGISAGGGITVPVGPSLRAFAEARWHGLLGATTGPSSLVPITLGLRY